MGAFHVLLERQRFMKRHLEESLALRSEGLSHLNIEIEQLERLPKTRAQKQAVDRCMHTKQTLEDAAPMQDIEELARLFEETKQKIEEIFQEMSGVQILNARKELESMDAPARNMITASVSKHGNGVIREANVFHACASNGEQDLMGIVLEFVPAQDRLQVVNSLDRDGATPLMVAACSGCNNDTNKVELCHFLVNLGADKDLVDTGGMTALGNWEIFERGFVPVPTLQLSCCRKK
jgi:hypothetical protein